MVIIKNTGAVKYIPPPLSNGWGDHFVPTFYDDFLDKIKCSYPKSFSAIGKN